MIKFNKHVNKVLPYDRRQYKEYLLGELDPPTKWYRASFHLLIEEKEISLIQFVANYECWFKNIISRFDNNSFWIVNHDKTDEGWFPNNEDNLTCLRALFKQNNIPNEFKGALIFSKDELFKLSKDLISYPYAVFNDDHKFYTDLDISHGELPFVIKILDHLSIHLLSTDKDLLRRVVNESCQDIFIIKQGKNKW
ncbi:hypothetical protein [Mucilaginibacter sp.]|uniref:hypothetical protein n=1 Tax=Mucilaginibacter sp. TaxID=1882438 RepID=UPI003D0C4E68